MFIQCKHYICTLLKGLNVHDLFVIVSESKNIIRCRPPVAVFTGVVNGVRHVDIFRLLVDSIDGGEYFGCVFQCKIREFAQLLFESSV